jgi:hypothetical protein
LRLIPIKLFEISGNAQCWIGSFSVALRLRHFFLGTSEDFTRREIASRRVRIQGGERLRVATWVFVIGTTR